MDFVHLVQIQMILISEHELNKAKQSGDAKWIFNVEWKLGRWWHRFTTAWL